MKYSHICDIRCTCTHEQKYKEWSVEKILLQNVPSVDLFLFLASLAKNRLRVCCFQKNYVLFKHEHHVFLLGNRPKIESNLVQKPKI